MRRKGNKGQGMTEYIIILALIAIASIGVMRIFGSAIKYQTSKAIGAFLDNKKGVGKRPQLTKKATKARTMKDFADSAHP